MVADHAGHELDVRRRVRTPYTIPPCVLDAANRRLRACSTRRDDNADDEHADNGSSDE
jgi:hypothetical protein